MFQLATSNLGSRFLGFDKLFWDMDNFLADKISAYPFFDVIATENGNKRIEIAVAGFSKEDVNVSFNKATRILEVTGQRTKEEKNKIYSSIASRNFSKSFTVSPTMTVGDITMENGILAINLIEESHKLAEADVLKLPIK